MKKMRFKDLSIASLMMLFMLLVGFSYTPLDRSSDILSIQKGLVPGHSIMSAMGERSGWGLTVTGEDVWRGNELSPAPTSHTTIPVPSISGDLMTVVSESVNDDDGGTGVNTVMIHYLDPRGNESEVLVTLDGTTPVSITTDTMIFINDFHTESAGSNGVADGHIKIYKTGTVGLVYNMIAEGGNQSLVPNRMIPNDHTFFLQGWNATEAQNKRITFRLRATDKHGHLEAGIFCFKSVAYIKQTASPQLPAYNVSPEFSIIKPSGWAIQAAAEGSVNFWGILVHNDYL